MPLPAVRLEPWTDADFDLLVRFNTPAMTEHLGGPEPPAQLTSRHRRYLDAASSGSTFVFRVTDEKGEPVGQVAFWEREWDGRPTYEMGWQIVPERQRQGYATAAVSAAVDRARALGRRDAVHAFPDVANAASNALCRRLGFELRGEHEFEYPKGHLMRCNIWRLRLAPSQASP